MRLAHCALILSILTGFGASTLCADARYVELSKKGRKSVSVTLTANDPRPSELVFYIASTGNSSQRFDLTLSSDAHITASVDYKVSSLKANLLSEVSKDKSWLPLKVYTGKLRRLIEIDPENSNDDSNNGDSGGGDSGGDSSGDLDPDCGCLSEATIQSILQMYASMGVNISRAEFCKEAKIQAGNPTSCGSGSSSGGGTDGGGDSGGSTTNSKTVTGFGFLEKDSCAKKRYPVVLRVNLDKLSDADYQRGITISAKMSFNNFVLPKKLILKRSDGGIFPNALIALLPFASSYSYVEKESKEVIVWRRNKVVYRAALTGGDTMYGLGYHRALYGGVLAGPYRNQRVNFQVTSPFPSSSSSYWYSSSLHAYSRCVPLVDRRQEVQR